MKTKQHLEFVKVDLKSGWEVPPGYPPGSTRRSSRPTSTKKEERGSRTRLLKIEPGAFSPSPSSTTTGKRSTWCRATSWWATTSREGRSR